MVVYAAFQPHDGMRPPSLDLLLVVISHPRATNTHQL